MKVLKKGLAVALAAAMVVTMASVDTASAAKKVKLSTPKTSITEGKTKTLKIKNGKKKAKVSWKTSKKSIAKITKKSTAGKTASATIKGMKVGTATITATYKLNKKSTKLTCKVTVKSDTATDPVVTSAPVVTTAPVTTAPAATKAPVTASPVVDPTAKPTAKPTNTPRPSATPSPTPMPIGEATFDDVTNAVKLDLSTFAKAEGSGAYDATNNRVTINDTSSSDISQGSFVLPETVSIKTDDLVSFRVQGYYYGTNGFRFWIGSPTSGGCTPIELTPNVQEGREVGDYPEQIESLYVNQMSIGQDATTNAFDVTFTFKAGTTQNDTNGQFPNLTMKYVMDEGFINGLVITNIYYLGDGTIDDPVPTPEPEMTPAITVDGTIDELWDSVEYQDVSNFSATAGNTSAQAKVMWDEDYLYILANVTDDQIDASSENAWTRDGIEIFLDEDNSGEATYAENTDAFQYRFTGFGQDEELNWLAATTSEFSSPANDAKALYADMAIEYAVTEAGYVVECAIPWVEKAVEGKKFSMEMTVMDCTDGVRANEIWLFGTQVGNLYQDPSLMSEVELTADNKLVMPEPDVEPGDDKVGIDLSGANLIYGKGKLTKNEDGSVTASNEAEGLLIPIGKDVAVGEKVTVTVYGTTTGVARI